ncbi:MAG TPA: hypothetical protein VIM11_25945 [Tepidisphaeraceae bacterium]|jgi:hypothetical protein
MDHDDVQWNRIEGIVGADDDTSWDEARKRFLEHLNSNLKLPCLVKGIEDFQWEEFYVIGPGDQREYRRLKLKQPSYTDVYELQSIKIGRPSEWMLSSDDIVARCRRLKDNAIFDLGLAELEAKDKKSKEQGILHDYGVWFVNSR